jgi:hypothetical protein
MIGHLIEVQPWFSEQSERSEFKRLGDLLTFQVEESRPLYVQYLYPRDSPPQTFPLSSKFVIQDIEAPPLELNPGYCFDAESSRVLNIRQLK